MSATDAVGLSDRLRGAIWGQFVGDAACLGSHWIYDFDELNRRYPHLEGFETPLPGHYHDGKLPGDQTHYGDAALLVLESLAETRHFDPRDFGKRFVTLMDGQEYRGYRDHATRGLLENYHGQQAADFDFQQGTADEQPATVTRLAPLVVAHLHDPHWTDAVTALTQVCQISHRALTYAKAHAQLLRCLLDGETLADASQAVIGTLSGGNPVETEAAERLSQAVAQAQAPVRQATLSLGQACPLTSSVPGALQAALHYPDNFPAAVLEAMQAGGDNAARCAMIGAWLGAAMGMTAIPADWRHRLMAFDRIEQATEILVSRINRAATPR